MFKHFLVPTDGSGLSHKAVAYAAEVARVNKARITVFYAKPPSQLALGGEGFLNDLIAPDKLEERAERLAQECLNQAAQICQAAGVPCHTVSVTSDTPAQAIIDAALREGCDLILMASHGRTGWSAVLVGSETQRVLAHTTLPVLVYR
ncbi:MAG: universal stress protein [Brachymonas sp.]|nr:universal stress protein [Brachymonas sp.]